MYEFKIEVYTTSNPETIAAEMGRLSSEGWEVSWPLYVHTRIWISCKRPVKAEFSVELTEELVEDNVLEENLALEMLGEITP